MLLYFLRLEEYFSVIMCTFYIIDCVQGLEFFHCNFYTIGLEKNHFGQSQYYFVQTGNEAFCSVVHAIKGEHYLSFPKQTL